MLFFSLCLLAYLAISLGIKQLQTYRTHASFTKSALRMVADGSDAKSFNQGGNKLKEQAKRIREELAALQAAENNTVARTLQPTVNEFASDKSPSVEPVRGTFNASVLATNVTKSSASAVVKAPSVNPRELIVKSDDPTSASAQKKISMSNFSQSKGDLDEAEEDVWVYNLPEYAAEVDKLTNIDLTVDIDKELQQKAPDLFNWALRGLMKTSLEGLLETYETVNSSPALRSIFRLASVEVIVSLANSNVDFSKFFTGEVDLAKLIQERVDAILEEKFREAGLISPRTLYLKVKKFKKDLDREEVEKDGKSLFASTTSILDELLRTPTTPFSQEALDKKWIYMQPQYAAEVDSLSIEPVTDIDSELERQAPGLLPTGTKDAVGKLLEELLASSKNRYPSAALQSLFRSAAVKFVLVNYVSEYRPDPLPDLTRDINEKKYEVVQEIEESMVYALEERFTAAGKESPRTRLNMKETTKEIEGESYEELMQTLDDMLSSAIKLVDDMIDNDEAEDGKNKIDDKKLEALFEPQTAMASSASNNTATTETFTVDRQRLVDLSLTIDKRIKSLPSFRRLSVQAYLNTYRLPEYLSTLGIPPEDMRDEVLVDTALKVALLGFFDDEIAADDFNRKKNNGWFKNPFAVVNGIQKAYDQDSMALAVNSAIIDLKKSLGTASTAQSTTSTATTATQPKPQPQKQLIIAKSDNNSDLLGQPLSYPKNVFSRLYGLVKTLEEAVENDDKEKLRTTIAVLKAKLEDVLKRPDNEALPNRGGAGGVGGKGRLLQDMQSAMRSPEKKLFGGLSNQIDELLSNTGNDNKEEKQSLSDRIKQFNDNNNKRRSSSDKKMKSRLTAEDFEQLYNYRSQAEKFIVTHFDPVSRQEVGEISRKGASVLQGLLLQDIFRVTRIKYFNGAVIFGGELIETDTTKFMQTFEQRMKENKLDNDFGYTILEDELTAESDANSMEVLALDEPFPTVILFPKAWRSRADAMLEEAKENTFSGRNIASFFYTALITSFCGMSTGVLDFARNSNNPNELFASFPSTEQLQTTALMIAATLGIQGVANLVENLAAQKKNVRLAHTSVPGLDFLTFGAKSTYLTLVKTWKDVFDLAAIHAGTSLTLSLAAMSLGLKLMAGQSKEVIAAYPTLSVGFLQINAFIKAIISSQFPDIFLGLDAQSLVHLHWLVIVGAMSFIGQVTQLLPGDNTAGDKMLSSVTKDNFISLTVRVALGVTKAILLGCAVFNIANINEGITRAKLLISYTITGGVGRDEAAAGPPVIDRLSNLDEARKILYFLFVFVAVVSFIPTDLNFQDAFDSLSSTSQQVDFLFRSSE